MPYLLLAMASIFWGGNYVAGHILIHYVNPYTLTFFRWGFTTILMFSIYWKVIFKEWYLLKNNLFMNSIYSLLGQVVFPLTLYIGLQYTSSLNAAIYISSTPCLVLMINSVFFKEKISYKNILGVLISTFGVLYLAFSNSESGSSLSAFGFGDVMTIVSALSWAGYCSLLRLKDKKVSNTAFVGFCSMIGTIILFPLFIINIIIFGESAIFVSKFSWVAIIGIVYLVVFPSWLSYVFWSKGVSMIGTTRSEIFTHGIPISGGLLGIFLLGENIHLYHVISLLLIIFGIVFCSTHKEKSQELHNCS